MALRISMEQISTAGVPSQKNRMLAAVPRNLLVIMFRGINRLADILIRIHVSPNLISVLGLAAGVGAGVLFAMERSVWAAVLIIVCGVFDILDGRVAVNSHTRSLYGAIFDSTLDRYAEFFIYLGLAVHFRVSWALWLPFFAFLGSAMVSYTRARAEGLGIDCRVGFMQRAERMALLVIAALTGRIFRVFDLAMIIVLVAIALVSNVTAFQRIYHVKTIEIQMRKNKEA
jgi:CDP-diacylglycerol--glycerol-3-phosphate 3-phosphatidyltransferase